MPIPAPGPFFLIWCRDAVDLMKKAGLTEHQIADITNKIRSAAIHEERERLSALLDANPAKHISVFDMEKALKV